MDDQRRSQIMLYNAFGYYDNRDWKPDNHNEIEDAEAWSSGMTEDQLLAIANGEVIEKSEPEAKPAKVSEKPQPKQVSEPKAKILPAPISDNLIKKTPEFPKAEAFQGAFDLYWQAYGDKNEVCPSYHFASALAQVSMALGKNYYISGNVGKYYPNWYQALIGTSYIAAKSMVLDDTSDAIRDIYEVDADASTIYRQTSTFDSAEGIKASFATHDEKGERLEWYDGKNGMRRFAYIDELRYLFVKAKQSATEGLTPELTKIYKCPRRLQVETKHKPILAEHPVLNLMGCTTLEWFEESINLSDISGGFLNRFVFYLHEQQPLFPFMDDVNKDAETQWQSVLHAIGRESLKSNRIFDLDEAVTDNYREFYMETKGRVIENPAEIETIAGARIVEHTLKLALVFSVIDNGANDNMIHMPAWESAVAVASYWAEVTKTLFRNIAIDKFDKLEQTILAKLAELNNDTTWTNLRKKMSGRTNTNEFNRAIENLLIAEFIAVSDSRPKRIVRIN